MFLLCFLFENVLKITNNEESTPGAAQIAHRRNSQGLPGYRIPVAQSLFNICFH